MTIGKPACREGVTSNDSNHEARRFGPESDDHSNSQARTSRADGTRGAVVGAGVGDKGCVTQGTRIICVDPRHFRPTQVEAFLGDPSNAREKLGWPPKISLAELEHELKLESKKSAQRNKLVWLHGHDAPAHCD